MMALLPASPARFQECRNGDCRRCGSGEMAAMPKPLEIARVYRPQLILLDLGLPGMTGYDVAKRLREEECGKGTLIVEISGYGQEVDRRRSQAAGSDHHLVEPVSYDELRGLLDLRSNDPSKR
jgi:CheY-like chemotaxis protein